MDADDLFRVVLVLVAIFLLAPLVMMTVVGPMMLWGVGGMGGGGVGLWWFVSSLVPLVLVVGIGYLLYRALHTATSGSDPAIEELRTAYARGELSDEEFETRYERLRRDESTTGESREG